ncbi:GGDEF domain-containing protein [Caldicellulosiruptor morganii]|uniref:GGDEF domain-containing protein n=1 Tax=Caldicellulosiruptor morganii TaxID=1387555 RepID=A0ABY7BP07_9FIRM|nr:GGDEF domain-containing protein [Caldicellulosiruptor morganii]WAM34265.1 GGDEF domain-containing protein [Caldicellulosiruptor morganii]
MKKGIIWVLSLLIFSYPNLAFAQSFANDSGIFEFYIYKSVEIVGFVALCGIFILSIILQKELGEVLLHNFSKIFAALTILKFVYVLNVEEQMIYDLHYIQSMVFLGFYLKILIVYSILFSAILESRVKEFFSKYSILSNVAAAAAGIAGFVLTRAYGKKLFLLSQSTPTYLYLVFEFLIVFGLGICSFLFIKKYRQKSAWQLKAFVLSFLAGEMFIVLLKRKGVLIADTIQNLALLYLFIAVFLNVILKRYNFLQKLSMFSNEVLKEKLDVQKSFDLLVDFVYDIYSGQFERICFYYHREDDYFELISTKGENFERNFDNFKDQIELKIDEEYFKSKPDIQVLDIQGLKKVIQFSNEFYINKLDNNKKAVLVPVFSQKKIAGFLICYTRKENFNLNSELADGLLIFRNFSQALLHQIQRIEKIKNLSLEDELTGLYNRRYFIKELILESISCDRYKGKFCLAFFDMDNLKFLNDFYGHAIGDRAIRLIARIIRDNIRKIDIPARLGGDEFAVIFKNCTQEAIEDRIKSIKKLIEEESEKQLPKPIRVSCGIAVYPDDTNSLDELLKIADMRMYEEKLKNRGEIK